MPRAHDVYRPIFRDHDDLELNAAFAASTQAGEQNVGGVEKRGMSARAHGSSNLSNTLLTPQAQAQQEDDEGVAQLVSSTFGFGIELR